MTESSPGPFFVKINTQSAYAPHSLQIPTLNASVAIGDPSHWNFLHPLGDTEDVTAAIGELCALMQPFFHTSYSFDNFVLYSQPDPDDVATPVFSDTIALLGTSASPGWDKATQCTFTFRTNEFGIFKLIMLDYDSGNNFDRVTVLPSGGADDLLRDYIVNIDSWIVGRDGGKPQTFLQKSSTLNEKLRRSYRMT